MVNGFSVPINEIEVQMQYCHFKLIIFAVYNAFASFIRINIGMIVVFAGVNIYTYSFVLRTEQTHSCKMSVDYTVQPQLQCNWLSDNVTYSGDDRFVYVTIVSV